MIPATEKEEAAIRGYMEWQAPDLTVVFLQKVYSEFVLDHRHDVWDVHTNVDRWWVITNPTNLYSQEQFPNMDYAVTFHVGLCIRIPRADRNQIAGLPIEPFARPYRLLGELNEALHHAEGVADYQAIGVRCREALLVFVDAAQVVMPWTGEEESPKRADVKAWTNHICTVSLSGPAQKDRRKLFKGLLLGAWDFANWLTHAKNSRWHDAEAAEESTSNAITLCLSSVIQFIRGVPDSCPACGSHRLTPQRAFNPDDPDDEWERPACTECEWTGTPVKIEQVPTAPEEERPPPEGDCLVDQPSLRKLKRPGDSD